EISEPEISLKNAEGADKKVVIAMPVDQLSFEGEHLVVCFMEVDMETMLNSVSLKSDDSTTFCNIYTDKGVALTNMVLGGLSSEDNLLQALDKATFSEGYSEETVVQDFANHSEGVATFEYNNIKETLYYVPIHATDWMLTYLVRESVISEQVQSISSSILTRNLVLSILSAVVLILVFTFIIIQNRKNAKLTLAKEITETESRVRQQELEEQMAMQEEQMAMQEELLEQEKQRAQQDRMITALASDYRSVYYVDLDLDLGTCYREDMKGDHPFSEGEDFSFYREFSAYAEEYVDEEYRDGFLDFIRRESIRERLAMEVIIAYRYLIHRNGVDSYEMLRMAGVRHVDDRDDHIVHAVGVGFTDIDAEMRESLAKKEALSQALDAARSASKAKTSFLSNMSHEIRTPMNAIIGLNSLALNEPDLSDSTRDYLEKIGISAEHLLGLINEILDMSRIESGQMILKKEEFAFHKMIEQINTIFTGQCEEKGLTYECDMKEPLADYYIGDDIKLRQVLINILGNAVKFTPEGGRVDFIVEKKASFDNHTTLQFTIRDTGIGMSREYLPKLFETFSQEDTNATNKYGSSGLGMAITKNIVEMMDGTIHVDSMKGMGTTFTVTVTLSDSERKEDPDEVLSGDGENSDTAEQRKAELKGRRILLAEDMEINAQIMLQVLSMREMEADHAANGRIAVDLYSEKPEGYYDAILMDMRMPELNGLEATEAIRASGRSDAKTIPIIALTANAFDEDVRRSLQAGLNAHLSKPVEPELLFETLENMIKD
ncbi:MAG: response regulator, partial [Eubacterium sp.]|nr:response regulator [Eubacterium sp.]